MSAADFDDDMNLTDKKCHIILFYTDWCGHCNDFKPKFAEFADIAQFIRVGKLNADDNKTVCEKMSIESYPTIWGFKMGEHSETYDGDREDINALIEWAKNICGEKCTCE